MRFLVDLFGRQAVDFQLMLHLGQIGLDMNVDDQAGQQFANLVFQVFGNLVGHHQLTFIFQLHVHIHVALRAGFA